MIVLELTAELDHKTASLIPAIGEPDLVHHGSPISLKLFLDDFDLLPNPLSLLHDLNDFGAFGIDFLPPDLVLLLRRHVLEPNLFHLGFADLLLCLQAPISLALDLFLDLTCFGLS